MGDPPSFSLGCHDNLAFVLSMSDISSGPTGCDGASVMLIISSGYKTDHETNSCQNSIQVLLFAQIWLWTVWDTIHVSLLTCNF